MQIIIDGYNLLYNSPKHSTLAHQDLEQARQTLLTDLARYARRRKHKILVVFDGWQGGHHQESRKTEQGVAVIYSRRGERADEVIKRLAQEAKKELAVVTSDRGIIQAVGTKRALTLGVEEFLERLRNLEMEELKGREIEAELVKAKKGNPHKLPKTERKKRMQWEKI